LAKKIQPLKLKKDSYIMRFTRQWQLQTMVLPAIIFIFIFMYLPMWGVLIGFKDYNIYKGFAESPWVGLKHFRYFINLPEFPRIMKNTLGISIAKLVFGFPAPIILALMLNEVMNASLRRTIQTISYLPHFISWVIVAGFVFELLSVNNGSVNLLLRWLGIIDENINWMSRKEYFWGILVVVNIWKGVGFNAIIYLAAISGIDPTLYEAAVVEGAGKLKRIIYITLPCISTTIIILLILSVGNILNAGYDDIMLLTNMGKNGILYDVSNTIDIHVYTWGIEKQRFSYATAVGVFKSVLNVVMLYSANAISRKLSDSSLW